MNTYIITYRDSQGFKKRCMFTEYNQDIIKGRLAEKGFTVLSLEHYA